MQYTFDEEFCSELTALLAEIGPHLPNPEGAPPHLHEINSFGTYKTELQKAEEEVATLRAQANLRKRHRAALAALQQRGTGTSDDPSHCACGSITCATHGCAIQRLGGAGVACVRIDPRPRHLHRWHEQDDPPL